MYKLQSVSKKLDSSIETPSWQLIELGLSTEASLFIAPLQDLLSLGNEARFNTPGTVGMNWEWRLNSFDKILEFSLREFGERGAAWGRR